MIRMMKKGSAVAALAAALLVTTALPARAGGLGPGTADAGWWDGAWKWLAALRLPGLTRPEPGAPEVTVKEGTGIDPDGAPGAHLPTGTVGEQGSGIDPNG